MHHALFVLFLGLAATSAAVGAPDPVPSASADPADSVVYVCPPCGCRGDDTPLAKPGNCPVCGMEAVDRATTLTLEAIPGFFVLNDSVWMGGQPTKPQLDLLKAGGVKTIVNLRLPSEHDGAGEAARAKELGIAYVGVPVDFDSPTQAEVDSFLAATDAVMGKGRVFIHCAAAIRVGSFWMVRRVVRDGLSYDEAREEARRISLRRDGRWTDFAKEAIEARKGGRR